MNRHRISGWLLSPLAVWAVLAPMGTAVAQQEGRPSTGTSVQPASTQLKVAVAQPLVVPGQVETNLQNMEPLLAEAVRRGAQLVLFSECGVTGYDLKGVGAKSALSLDAPVFDRLIGMARRHGGVVVAGFHEKSEQKLHNSAVICFPDGRHIVQRKYNIMEPEQKVAAIIPGGRERAIFEVGGFHCAVLICSDDGIPGICEELSAARCDVVLLMTAGGGSDRVGLHQADLADPQCRKKYLDLAVSCISRDGVDRCLRLNFGMVACNQAGWDAKTGYFHPGGSSIIDRTGEVTAVIPPRFVFEHLRPDLAVGFVSRGLWLRADQ